MISDTGAVVPAHIPVKKLQQHIYCPRLFYLEWADAQFEYNAFVREGEFVHRAVDRPTGAMASADAPEPTIKATSVDLGDDDLGLTAKVDMIERGDGLVVPVEVKRSEPPKHGLAWLPHTVQLCAQGLLLRNAGYRVEHGEIYYAGTRERIKVPFDEQLVSRTLYTIAEARHTAAQPQAPAPLIDSPKCPGCSLVGICLPDEVNFNAGRSVEPPRRLTPRDSAARPMYVTTQGAKVGTRGGHVVVTLHGDELARHLEINVSQIIIFGNAQVSTQLIRKAARKGITISWFSFGGWFENMAAGLPGKNVELRRKQFSLEPSQALDVSRQIVRGKIQNSRTLLMRNSKSAEGVDETTARLRHLANSVDAANDMEQLLGTEGAAARAYFSEFASMFTDFGSETFEFEGRNRRPPRDPVNALLSLGYALLTNSLTAACYSVGFDPYCGIMHQDRFGRPSLALDIAEEFRPIIVESVVLSVLNNRQIKSRDFIERASGVALKDEPRKVFLNAYERRLDDEITHPTYNYKVTYRRALELQSRVMAAHLLGEIPEYVPLVVK